jgi:putative membrane protein
MKRLIWGMIIAVLAMVFALQNSDPVSVHMFFWKAEGTSLALILATTFIGGVATGILFALPQYLKKSKELEKLVAQQALKNQFKP